MAFLEIVLDARELRAGGILSRDEIEEPLEEALAKAATAEITSGGGGAGRYNIDVEVHDEADLDAVVDAIRHVLQQKRVPGSTLIKQHKPTPRTFSIY